MYGYFSVRGLKPGATLYATYSDPRAATEGSPVYMAGQFFGSGRVFYLGSGEMWRLRELDETYFEQFYTKLIRHVSQGRLLRGSNRGVLLVERDRYLLGNTVAVRAQLNDAQLEPLEAPSVKLEIIAPGGELADDRSGGRPRPGGNLWRAVQRLSGRGLSPGAAPAGRGRRAAVAADPGESPRPGARASGPQRRPADRAGPDERRRILHRHRSGPWEATASRGWSSGCPTAARPSR